MAKAISATYGPRGGTVMLDRASGLLSTRDGASVAWEIEPENSLERLGTRVVQAGCAKVNLACGDGTTTTAVLIHALVSEAHRWVAAGIHPAMLSQEISRLGNEIVEGGLLDLHRQDVESEDLLYEVALSASNRDADVARAITDAMSRVGSEGMVVVEEGKGREIELDHKAGLKIERGWESSELSGDDGGPRHLDAPLVLLLDMTLTKMEQLIPFLEEATQFPHPLVIVSRGCFGTATKLLVANDRKLKRADGGTFEVIAVRAPGREDLVRERLGDLAALTGARIVDQQILDASVFSSEMFGSAQTITVKKNSTTFLGFPDKFELIEERVERLRRIEASTTHTHDVEEIRTRIAHLTDGFCVMRVGGWSPTEIRERRARVEDALHAVRVAVNGGVVPGAGMAYLAAAEVLGEGGQDEPAIRVLQSALRAPLATLARNAGASPPVVLASVLEASRQPDGTCLPGWDGWDATRGQVRDLRLSPVLCDPYEVVRDAWLVAVSTAATLLSAEIAITRVQR